MKRSGTHHVRVPGLKRSGCRGHGATALATRRLTTYNYQTACRRCPLIVNALFTKFSTPVNKPPPQATHSLGSPRPLVLDCCFPYSLAMCRLPRRWILNAAFAIAAGASTRNTLQRFELAVGCNFSLISASRFYLLLPESSRLAQDNIRRKSDLLNSILPWGLWSVMSADLSNLRRGGQAY